MTAVRIVFLAFLLGIFQPANAQLWSDVQVLHQEPLRDFSLIDVQSLSAQGNRKPGTADERILKFNAFGRQFDMRLHTNHALLDVRERQNLSTSIAVYRGEIEGEANSWVRMVVVDGQPQGMFWDGEQMFAVERQASPNGGGTSLITYRLADVSIPSGALSCELAQASNNAMALLKTVVSEAAAAGIGPGATSELEIGLVSDFEFNEDFGSGAEAAMLTRMNNVDGIFSMQTGVQLTVTAIDSFTDSNDPFTDESDAGDLLDEVADFRNSSSAQNSNGLTHFFTGRDLDGSTVGVAFTGALCLRQFGAGLTSTSNNAAIDSLIAAHEIGHNFGAPHDGTSGSACEAEAQDFLMAPSINGSDQFSSCSIAQMQDDINRASCISPLPSTDIAVVSGATPGAVFVGDSLSLTFEVNSVGTADANNVTATITIPAQTTVTSVSASSGSCTVGAGSAVCTLGTIAAGSGTTISISGSATNNGTAQFAASATATTDANSNNNDASISFDIDSAVDLESVPAVATQVQLNASASVRMSVNNLQGIAATDVTVTITPAAGLTVNSASWAAGTCSVASGTATCIANSVAAQSNNSLTVEIAGLAEGTHSYELSALASEVDRNTANNTINGQIDVLAAGTTPTPTPPPPADDDGGGGPLTWLSVVAGFLLFRRYRVTSQLI